MLPQGTNQGIEKLELLLRELDLLIDDRDRRAEVFFLANHHALDLCFVLAEHRDERLCRLEVRRGEMFREVVVQHPSEKNEKRDEFGLQLRCLSVDSTFPLLLLELPLLRSLLRLLILLRLLGCLLLCLLRCLPIRLIVLVPKLLGFLARALRGV